jgi:hypothetical protein
MVELHERSTDMRARGEDDCVRMPDVGASTIAQNVGVSTIERNVGGRYLHF